jgi:mannose/fructose-specific phosphotransferase system component IIA
MENKVLVISASDLVEYLQPILQKMEKMEAILLQKGGNQKAIFSDSEAAEFLNCSTKKLQSLRNTRAIGFIRENGGRKILYKIQHLMEYLENNEFKRKK